jgi:hypothetical protein
MKERVPEVGSQTECYPASAAGLVGIARQFQDQMNTGKCMATWAFVATNSENEANFCIAPHLGRISAIVSQTSHKRTSGPRRETAAKYRARDIMGLR